MAADGRGNARGINSHNIEMPTGMESDVLWDCNRSCRIWNLYISAAIFTCACNFQMHLEIALSGYCWYKAEMTGWRQPDMPYFSFTLSVFLAMRYETFKTSHAGEIVGINEFSSNFCFQRSFRIINYSSEVDIEMVYWDLNSFEFAIRIHLGCIFGCWIADELW